MAKKLVKKSNVPALLLPGPGAFGALTRAEAAWNKGAFPQFWPAIATLITAQGVSEEVQRRALEIIDKHYDFLGSDAPGLVGPIEKVAKSATDETAEFATQLLEDFSDAPTTTRTSAAHALLRILAIPEIPSTRRKRVATLLSKFPSKAMLAKVRATLSAHPLGDRKKNQALQNATERQVPISSERIAALFQKGAEAWHRGKRFRTSKVTLLKGNLPFPTGQLVAFGLYSGGLYAAVTLRVPKGTATISLADGSNHRLVYVDFGSKPDRWQLHKKQVSMTAFSITDQPVLDVLESESDAVSGLALSFGDSLVTLPGNRGTCLLMESFGQNDVRFHVGHNHQGEIAALILEAEFNVD